MTDEATAALERERDRWREIAERLAEVLEQQRHGLWAAGVYEEQVQSVLAAFREAEGVER